jgi:DegV family protein with EDD domain
MKKIRIVVDSAADFPVPSVVARNHISVVPHTIHFGDEKFIDGVEMDAERFFQHISHDVPYPKMVAPTVEQFAQVYNDLSQTTDQIISLHTTHTLSKSWENAKQAADSMLGRCEIAVLDAQTTAVGLGLLAETTARAANEIDRIEDAVRYVRGAIGRVYSVFYVDTLDYIQHNGLLGEAQAILGAMLNIKPFLTIEEGHLTTMEKVRTRSQAVDKLVEFVTEFDDLEKLVIVQNSPFMTEAVRLLQDRLAAELSQRNFPMMLYGPMLASYLGPDATGVIVLEKDYE